MRKILLSLLLPILFFLTTSTTIYARYENPLGNKLSGDIVTVRQDEIVNKDFFAAGDIIEILGTVNGDVYVAGRTVTVNGTINGDLLVAGEILNLAGTVTDDIRAAGGDITISANVGKNVTVFGGNIDITDSAKIAGSVVGGGGNFLISTMTLSNYIGGDVETGIGELRITPNANLAGDLYYYSEEEADISSSATILGVIERNDPAAKLSAEMDEEQLKRDAQGFFQGITTAGRMISFTSLLIIGLLIMKLFPNYSLSVTETLKKRPLRSIGLGTLALFITPVASVVLMITVIGIPISLITIACYIITLYVSRIFVMLWVGEFLMEKINKKSGTYSIFLLGLIAYSVVAFIPVIGGFVKFFVLLLSLGAMLLTCEKTYKKARSSKIY
jgi:hypothetical protein